MTTTYKAIKTDLKKLEIKIAKRQRYCEQAVAASDLDMARMYEKDVKDLTDILNYINDTDFKSAWDIIYWVDTAVRDDVPVRLFNFLAKENGYSETIHFIPKGPIMKQSDVHIGTQYTCKVTHKLVVVEILSDNPNGGWDARNLSTGKTILIKSAQRLRGFAKGANTSPPVAKDQPTSRQPATRTKSTNTPQRVANKRLSAQDAAVKVLTEAAEPMNCRQLIEAMTEKDYWQPKNAGKTPQNTLHAAISKEIKTKGADSRFAKVGRSQFALAQ